MPARPAPPKQPPAVVATRFIADLQAGRRPSIEAALDSVPNHEWSGLLQSLLAAEINERRARGENPHPREYLPRFPAHMSIVRSVLPDASAAQTVTAPNPAFATAVARPVAAVPQAVPVMGRLEPSVRVPVATAYAGPPVTYPAPIVEPIAFENFEPAPDPAPARRRRQRKRLQVIGAAFGLLLGAGTIVTIIILSRGKRKEEPPPVATGTTTPKIATSATINLVGPKNPTADSERELAEWILSIGGRGTVIREIGGELPFSAGTPLPKVKFAVSGVVLPAMSAGRWQPSDLEKLRGREKLSSVQLAHSTALIEENLAALAGLPLRTLELQSAEGNVQVGGEFLAKFPELEMISLLPANTFNDTDLQALTKLPKLRSLSVNSKAITPAGFKDMKNPLLRSLTLGEGVRITPELVRTLLGMPIEDFACDAEIQDDAFLEFAVMPNIRRFHLKKARISDEGLKAVLGLGKLEEFRAIGSSIAGPGLEHLAERKGLRVIDLSGSKLQGDAISQFLTLPLLKELRLGGISISNVQANLLAQLEFIEILDLSGTNFSDAQLTIMKGHGSLKSLILTGTKVSKKAIAEFEAGTPKCKVIN